MFQPETIVCQHRLLVVIRHDSADHYGAPPLGEALNPLRYEFIFGVGNRPSWYLNKDAWAWLALRNFWWKVRQFWDAAVKARRSPVGGQKLSPVQGSGQGAVGSQQSEDAAPGGGL